MFALFNISYIFVYIRYIYTIYIVYHLCMQTLGRTHVRIWKHLPCHTGRVIGLEANGKIKGLRCGVFTFLILVPCLNHTNPPRPCHLFLSDTPFNPLWMVLPQFHSVDNVILQFLFCFVFCRCICVVQTVLVTCCLSLQEGGMLKVSYIQATWLYCDVGVVHQASVVTVNYINHDLQGKSPFIAW